MSKLKFFQICTALLLALNIALLAFGFINRPEAQGHLVKKIAKDLSLDAEQEQSFEQLRKKHHDNIIEIDKNQKSNIFQIFENLPNEISNDPIYDDIKKSICELEIEKIQLTYNHFVELNSLLNTEQKKSFKPVVLDALNGILLRTKKGPKPPREF